jgi:ferric-dicitrate binding protein FerR (iron transport regulator)
MSNSRTISRLLFKYLQGTLTPEEEYELEKWKLQSAENRQFLEGLSKEAMPGIDTDGKMPGTLEEKIFGKIREQVPELHGNVIRMKGNWWRYTATAAVVLILFGYSIMTMMHKERPKQVVAKVEQPVVEDVAAPDGNYASITLAGGEKIDINGSSRGTLASQGKVQVIKSADGLIIYKVATGRVKGKMQFNTLANPKGSKVIGMVLEDGTKVWLNAGSSLTYPVAFIGKERKVSITGEAYFEVAKKKSMPFRIMKGEMMVEVLGTHFNVNAYGDEPHMKVTLLEGAVKVSSGNVSGILKPGQQAKVKDNDINVKSDVNVDQVMAWKNGYFSFEKAGITEVMRQIARWYNIEVAYDGEIPDERFGGELRRNSKLSSVLKVLEKSGVKFRIENNKVTVFK